MRARQATGRLVAAVVLSGVLAACSGPTGAGTVPPDVLAPAASPSASPSSSPSSSPTAVEARPARERPALVTWGGDGAHLALVVANRTGSTIRRALVEIEALDADGTVLLRTVGRPGSKCCTVLGVPPEGEFGLFATLPGSVKDVAEVRVRYADLALAPGSTGGGWVEVTDPRLRRQPRDTVVTARFTAGGKVPAYVVGQAFLVDGDDRLVAVISGRFFCFADGTRRRVRMELTRPMPAGTRIARALAHPIPAGVPTDVDHRCD